MADAWVIAYMRDHPNHDPTCQEIADASEGLFTDVDIRKTETWAACQRMKGRRATTTTGELGANDDALERLKGTKPAIRDRSLIRKNHLDADSYADL